MLLKCESDNRYTYRVLGGFPGLQLADILHILELSQLGQCVVTQCLVKRCVSVLVLHIKLGFCPHQELVRETKSNQDANISSAIILEPFGAKNADAVLEIVLRMTRMARYTPIMWCISQCAHKMAT